MKYENYKRAQEIVKKIEENSDILNKIDSEKTSIKVLNGLYGVKEIYRNSDGALGLITDAYINNLISYYQREIELLNKELETL